MLLPFDGLSYRIDPGGMIHPRWLGEDDEAFVEAVLELVYAFDGLTAGEVDLVAERELPALAKRARASSRIAESLWTIERKRWEAEVDAPLEPEAIRAVVFDCAATMPRDEALAQSALALGLAPDVIAKSLFADRATMRRLRRPERRSEPADLVARYNLAVVQTLLARAMSIEATTNGDPRALAAMAKRDGLLATMAPAGESSVRLVLVGPLALVHDTAKYGRSIARFVPFLVVAKEWSLRARIAMPALHAPSGRQADLVIDHRSPLSLAGTLASAAVPLPRKTARALADAGVRVDFQPAPLRAGSALVVPDFALEWGSGQKVYVDVLPFATDEHLAVKLQLIAALDVPMIVCVDERYAGGVASPAIVPFRRKLEAWTLLAAARTAVTRDAA